MYDWLTLFICAIIILFLFIVQLIVKAKNPLKKTVLAMFKGVLTLVAVNVMGIFTGVTLPISLFSIAVSAIVGVPGIATMFIFNTFL